MQKIMFNDNVFLTRATVEGTKTLTHRIMNPEGLGRNSVPLTYDDIEKIYPISNTWFFMRNGVGYVLSKNCWPRYKKGEIVAVAQSYENALQYINDNKVAFHNIEELLATIRAKDGGCKNKLFTKAHLLPLTIRIKDIYAHRIQDITDAECLKEGVKQSEDGRYRLDGFPYESYDTPREAYHAMIDKMYGKKFWSSNPWTYVYSYEFIKP